MTDDSRQRIERVPGARRARLTPAPGTDPEPDTGTDRQKDAAATGDGGTKGPNDERLRQDVPPHY
ncbi:hypothetical protein [Microbacterium sp.]|uniref:hypothetical protein n=1 Tax=Microbacterium sp. TaxID=51671 RepID=UPI002811666E|nr:hypothetical protein [Microbacterium sp.]